MPIEFEVLLLMLVLVAFLPFFNQAFVPKLSPSSESPATPHGRSGFFDMARGVAILAVVIIHFTYFLTTYSGNLDWANDFINNLMRFALPIFFVSSGVLLKKPDWNASWFKSFYGRRLLALGVPYAIITIILSAYDGTSLGELAYNLLTGNASVPLYFVPILFQLYILYPLVYRLAHKRWFVWLTLVISIISYAVPVLRWWQDLTFATPCLFFFVWGIYMSAAFRNNSFSPSLLPWLSIIGLFVGLQFYLGFERFFNGQFFYGLAVLAMLYHVYNQNLIPQKLRKLSEYIGQRSLWIFLTHFTLLQVLVFSLSPMFERSVFAATSLFVLLGLIGSLLVGVLIDYIYKQVVGLFKQ